MTPGLGRRHVERRLVALQRQQHLLLGDALAGLHVDLDDRHVLEIADIGKPDFTRHEPVSEFVLVWDRRYSRTRRMSSMTSTRWRMNRAAAAPSITR